MKRGIYFLDALFVILNISNPFSLLPCFIFTGQTGLNSAIIFGITIIYTFFRFGKSFKSSFDALFIIFLIINIYNLANSAISGTLAIGYIANFLACCAFFFFLYNLYVEYRRKYSFEETVVLQTKGYTWLSIYQLVIVALFFLLIRSHVINPLINEITWNYDMLADNASRQYSSCRYFFPYHICVISQDAMDRLPFLNLEGIVPQGVFHESQAMTYYIVPFLFLMHYLFNKKALLIVFDILFVIYIVVAASTTCFLSVLAVLLLWSVLKEREIVLLYIVLASSIVTFIQTTDNPIVELIRFKLDSGSMEYSASTLDFAFTPKSLLGTDFYDLSYLEKGLNNYDVGIIVFVLNIVFILILGYRTMKLCFSSNKLAVCVGLFSTYFMLHSTKLALRTYSSEMLIFIMFVVTICYNELIKNNAKIQYKRPLEGAHS